MANNNEMAVHPVRKGMIKTTNFPPFSLTPSNELFKNESFQHSSGILPFFNQTIEYLHKKVVNLKNISRWESSYFDS